MSDAFGFWWLGSQQRNRHLSQRPPVQVHREPVVHPVLFDLGYVGVVCAEVHDNPPQLLVQVISTLLLFSWSTVMSGVLRRCGQSSRLTVAV